MTATLSGYSTIFSPANIQISPSGTDALFGGKNISSIGNATITSDITSNRVFSNIVTITNGGNLVAGNVNLTGLASVGWDVTSTNGSLRTLSATGNVYSNNAILLGGVEAAGNLNGGNLNTGGVYSSFAKITGDIAAKTITLTGTIASEGALIATGNITAGNLITQNTLFTPNLGNVRTITSYNNGFTQPIGAITTTSTFAGYTVMPYYSLTTTTSTPATIASLATSTNSVIMIKAYIVGSRQSSSEGVTFDIFTAYKNTAGTLTLISPAYIVASKSSGASSSDANVVINGTGLDVQVTGTAHNWSWVCMINSASSIY